MRSGSVIAVREVEELRLRSSDGGAARRVAFDRWREVMGAEAGPAGVWPERWIVKGLPTEAELSEMGAG